MIWSKSRLKTYRECSLRYKFAYIDKLKPDRIESLDKGVILHEVFDKFYDELDFDKFKANPRKEFDRVITDMLKDNKIEGFTYEFYDTYSKHIESFFSFNYSKYVNYPDQFYPVLRESHFETAPFHGIIDRLDVVGDKVVVVDYKTSMGLDLSNYEDELLIYAWLVQQNTTYNPTHIAIFFTGNNNFVIEKIPVDFHSIIHELAEEAKMYELQIKEGKFEPTKDYWCTWCGYQRHCPLYRGGKDVS